MYFPTINTVDEVTQDGNHPDVACTIRHCWRALEKSEKQRVTDFTWGAHTITICFAHIPN
jgi:hypothetical protein